MPELLHLAASAGKAASKVMPWVFKDPRKQEPNATPDEVAAAEAELEAGIVFT